MCDAKKNFFDYYKEVIANEKFNGVSVARCRICGGTPSFSRERYVTLWGFNHTCKGITPNVHIKSYGYDSMEKAVMAWNRLFEREGENEQYPVDETGVEIDPRGGSGGMVLGGKVVQRWK